MCIKQIETIENASHYYETLGNRPVRVLCSDLNYYVCKHNNGSSCRTLFYEYLASIFLRNWDIKTPDIAFITVDMNHIQNCSEYGLCNSFFEKTCFGSKILSSVSEVEPMGNNLSQSKFGKKLKLIDFLKIALFDIWIANEDRTINNPNLLYCFKKGKNDLYAIDHEMIFNSNSGVDLAQITNEDSILGHNLLSILYKTDTKKCQVKEELFSIFDNSIVYCKESLSKVFENVPSDWKSDIKYLQDYIERNIFVDDWLIKTKTNFVLILDSYLRYI